MATNTIIVRRAQRAEEGVGDGLTISTIPDITLGIGQTHDMSQYITGTYNTTSMTGLGTTASYDPETELLTGLVAGTVTGVTLTALTVSPQGSRIPMPPIDTSSAEFTQWLAWVDAAEAGSPGYGFTAYEAGLMAKIAAANPGLGLVEADYVQLAIDEVEAQVTAAEAAIAGGSAPFVAGDSYLEVGELIRDVACVYDWQNAYLTTAQKARWEAYAEQAVWNIWNYGSAEWGGASFPWSGWSTSNPGNNYYYSFLTATMCWGMATNSSTWLSLLSDVKWPLLVSYFSSITDGGSLEGTGYGTSHMNLFRIYREWRQAFTTDYSASSDHCVDSIDWWVHATMPTLDSYAPIGSQSRDSSASMYDYQRRLMMELMTLNEGTAASQRGKWWLDNISVTNFNLNNGFNRQYIAMYDSTWPSTAPTATSYNATGTGNVFARSSWNSGATWVHFVCGRYSESHAIKEQGAFAIFKDTWLACTALKDSQSGITYESVAAQTGLGSNLRFEVSGAIINQFENYQLIPGYDNELTTFTDDGDVVTCVGDMSPCYQYYNSSDVISWVRTFVYTRSTQTIRVTDSLNLGAGVTAYWQISTPTQPTNNSGVITAGDLRITPVTPASPSITIQDWETINTDTNGMWKTSFTGDNSTFVVDIEILNAETV